MQIAQWYNNNVTDGQLAQQMLSGDLPFTTNYGEVDEACISIMGPNYTSGKFGTLPNFTNVIKFLTDNKVLNVAALNQQALSRMATLNWDVFDANGAPVKKLQALANDSNYPLAVFEYLNRFVAVSYTLKYSTDKNTGNVVCNRTIEYITRNFHLVEELRKRGMIDEESLAKVNTLKTKLFDVKELTALTDSKKGYNVWAMYLRPKRVVAGTNGVKKVIYEVGFSIRRTALISTTNCIPKWGNDGDTVYMILPIEAIYAEERILKCLLASSNNVFNIFKRSIDGIHDGVITYNANVVSSSYGTSIMNTLGTIFSGRDGAVMNAVAQNPTSGLHSYDFNRHLNDKGYMGYDFITKHHRFFDVQSSVSTDMSWKFAFGAIVDAKNVAIANINTRYRNVNPKFLNLAINTAMVKAKAADFDCMSDILPNITNASNQLDRMTLVRRYMSDISWYDIYDMATSPAHKQLFGDIDKGMQNHMKRMGYLAQSAFQYLTLPTDSQQRKDLLIEKLKEGVVELTIASKTKGVTKFVGTNNETALKIAYGENWEFVYATISRQLDLLEDFIEKYPHVTPEVLAELIKFMKIENRFEETFIYQDLDGRKHLIASARQNVEANKKFYKMGENDVNNQFQIVCKVADAWNVVDKNGNVNIYRSFNVANVISAAFSPVTSDSKAASANTGKVQKIK